MTRSIVGEVGSLVETSKTVDTNWFSTNLSPSVSGYGNAVQHTLMIRVPTSTVVQLLFDDGSDTDLIFLLNAGIALVANAVYVFDIVLLLGQSYNIQHSTTTQNIFCSVVEDRDIIV